MTCITYHIDIPHSISDKFTAALQVCDSSTDQNVITRMVLNFAVYHTFCFWCDIELFNRKREVCWSAFLNQCVHMFVYLIHEALFPEL